MSIIGMMNDVVTINVQTAITSTSGYKKNVYSVQASNVNCYAADMSPDEAKAIYGDFTGVLPKTFYFATNPMVNAGTHEIVYSGTPYTVYSVQATKKRLYKVQATWKPSGQG